MRGPKAWMTEEARQRLQRAIRERLPADVISERFRISPNHARNLARWMGIKLMSLEEFRGCVVAFERTQP